MYPRDTPTVSISQNVVEDKKIGCNCIKSNMKCSETGEVAELISDIMKSRKGQKARVKIEIEFGD